MIFNNLKGYDSHLTVNEIGKFNVKVDVIPNGIKILSLLTVSNF